MAEYRITGIWRTSGVITHYAVHSISTTTGKFNLPTKMLKADAVKLVNNKANSVKTMVWNYVQAAWYDGEDVYVVGTGTDSYLKSMPDSKLSDNLSHLPAWNGVIP